MKDRATTNRDIMAKARQEVEKKTGKAPEQLYEERENRVMDAFNLREPDRVPVALRGGYFPIKYFGASPSAVFYEPEVHKQAVIKTLLDFQPDVYRSGINIAESGPALEVLDAKQARWPGGTLPADVTFQVVSMETMKANEYDLFITDPTDFMVRYYLPRVLGTLEPLSRFGPLGQGLAGAIPGLLRMSPVFTRPEFQKIGKTLLKAGQEQAKFKNWEQEVCDLGFPPFYYNGGIAGPPFDWIADTLRGMPGVMTDMFRQPEKLLIACERVLEWRLARAVPFDPKKKEYYRRVGGPAPHYSSDRFLTRKQFEKFCWPTWKKALLATIDLGFYPAIFCEGKCDNRLEYFLELPKAKFMVRFEEVDMFRAKEILGNHCCISGDVHPALLEFGSPQEVEEYCAKLIKVCGKSGGFILSSGNVLDTAKPANVKAMVDSVQKYGRY